MFKGQPASPAFVAMVCLVLGLLALIVSYPGSLGWDATVQWYDARNAALTSHHPPFMAFVWHWLDRILPGPGLMLALQVAVFWVAVALLVRATGGTRGFVVCAAVGLAVQPVVLAYMGLVEKNVLAGNLALAAVAALIGFPAAARPFRVAVVAFMLVALAGLVRFQFWALLLPMLVHVLAHRPRIGPGRMATAAGALAVALVVIAAAQVIMPRTMLVTPSNDRNWRQVMLFDLGAAIALNPATSLDILARQGVDVGLLRARVDKSFSGRSVFQWTEAGPYAEISDAVGDALGEPNVNRPALDRQLGLDVFAAQWRALWAADPALLLRLRAAAFLRMLGVGGSVYACWPLTVVGFLGQPELFWTALDGASLRPSLSTGLLRSSAFPAGSFLFRPVTYLALSVFLLAGWAWRRPGGWAPALLLIGTAWLYWLTFLPFNPDCEVRYSYFPIVAILFALVYILGTVIRQGSKQPMAETA